MSIDLYVHIVLFVENIQNLIGHFEPEDILTVDQVNGESVYNRLSAEQLGEWLDDYTLDDLWKRNIITGGQPNND